MRKRNFTALHFCTIQGQSQHTSHKGNGIVFADFRSGIGSTDASRPVDELPGCIGMLPDAAAAHEGDSFYFARLFIPGLERTPVFLSLLDFALPT